MDYIILNLAVYGGLALILWIAYKIWKNKILAKSNLERAMNMVFLQVRVGLRESKDEKSEDTSGGGFKDFKELITVSAQLYDSLHSIYSGKWKNKYVGEDFFSFEYVVQNEQIVFYIVSPQKHASLIEKQVSGFFPEAYIEKVDEYNIFQKNSQIACKALTLSKHYMYPIKTFQKLGSDPINTITSALSKLRSNESAVIQIMVCPTDKWQKAGREEAKNILNQKKKKKLELNPFKLLKHLFDLLISGPPSGKDKGDGGSRLTQATEEEVKAMEEKNSGLGFEVLIRIVCASESASEAKTNLTNILSTFAQYKTANSNKFSGVKHYADHQLVEDYIYRNFNYPWYQKWKKQITILSSEELASIFHLPHTKFNKTPNILWQKYKVAPAPKNMPKEGLLLGHNHYRGLETEVRMTRNDRFRHFYVIGQTGTGKSSVFSLMIRQDLRNGDGLGIMDPHGSLVEDNLPFIPRERADDVIYFNPADTGRPMGLNLLEAETDDERELVALDAMNIMIKLFGNEIFGPRIQDYFRNGCLTLMAHPEGGTITDIVRLFTDDEFQQERVTHVKNPVVKSFWNDQMAKTGAREKQEMIPYFAAKFGQFITNSMMRNIIGQTKSAFDFTDVMQNKKILLINLSKGEVGDINSELLGLIIVSKLQMAALRRQRFEASQRTDFFLYIDEFQNYITDSIESILSEARKYRLSLNMAHQYISQLEGKDGKSKVKNAVFGNVGTMLSYKIGATDAEYMAKEMAPVFTDQDLINMDNFKGVMKLSIDGQPCRPFSITVPKPWLEKGDVKIGEAVKQLSRLKYGRDREFVEREITRRIGIIE